MIAASASSHESLPEPEISLQIGLKKQWKRPQKNHKYPDSNSDHSPRSNLKEDRLNSAEKSIDSTVHQAIELKLRRESTNSRVTLKVNDSKVTVTTKQAELMKYLQRTIER